MKLDSNLTGKRITLIRNLDKPNSDGHLAEEVEGLVEVLAPDGTALVIKPRGSTMNLMIEASEIEPDSIHIQVEKPRELKARKMGIVSQAAVRQHLLDRHGLSLSNINEMSDGEAIALHGILDHEELGHYHQAGGDE